MRQVSYFHFIEWRVAQAVGQAAWSLSLCTPGRSRGRVPHARLHGPKQPHLQTPGCLPDLATTLEACKLRSLRRAGRRCAGLVGEHGRHLLKHLPRAYAGRKYCLAHLGLPEQRPVYKVRPNVRMAMDQMPSGELATMYPDNHCLVSAHSGKQA